MIGHDPKLEDLATTILPKVIFPLNNADIGGKEQANQFEASSGIAEGLHQDIRDNFVTMIDMTERKQVRSLLTRFVLFILIVIATFCQFFAKAVRQ